MSKFSPISQQPDDHNLPLRSVHTNTFVTVLEQMGISLVVSTYQAGKLIVMRADGTSVNTHFRLFQKPMGIAVEGDRLAIGTASAIWELRNNPDTAKRIEPQGKHDACFLPRNIHFTGDIDIHEMAWVGEELWFVNTRFSCLCTLDKNYSFVPRWRPPFITAYDLRDRCHLNGLGLRDGQPKYVTALGETDTAGGWRNNKANGGILIDIQTNQILLRGLSMPHSPRWYNDRLWVLESGKGTLSYFDDLLGKLVTVAEVPGFTRGLDFYGNLAFIGLSQIRESAVFAGLPLTQRLAERNCGVWIVDIRNGQTIAFLKFEDAVQEIFAVSVLPRMLFPEVVDGNPELIGTTYVIPDEALANAQMPSPDWEFAQTYFTQGNQFYGQGKLEHAIASFRKCLELEPTHLPARYNLGVTLGDLGRYPEAIAQLEAVITAEALHADAYNSLGFIYSQQRQLDMARKYYQQAITIRNDFPKAHHNLGMTLLQLGELEQGWAECEWRWQTEQFTKFDAPQPRWQGEDITDQSLLVHTEQGAGDAIQFIRYIPLVAEKCKKLILVCTPNLIPIFEKVEGIDEIRTAGEISLQAFDTYIALMSLPFVLQTRLDNIPNQVPYLSAPREGREKIIDAIKQQQNPSFLKVGIVWSGSSTHANDHNRSCTLEDFAPLLQVPNLTFYSLQVGNYSQEINQLPSNTNLIDLSPFLNDYGDTAVAIAHLDLVISVDTSVAHLAGALAKPVWVALCYNPDWRWLLDRKNSPWYPTMRLFRQSQPQDWQTVFRNIAKEITETLF